ncbi:MAG: TetR/AcrR family transcriptional regulator [Acidobacteriota bacterium]|jgi:AcrR family transcriptional regulator|nr:TetR/AcrR family transcriptional regulator [Acidobacteriota bacterium]
MPSIKTTTETGKASRRQEERVEMTREKMLAAARKIFVRDGFDAARLEDIATDAGYTRGAFYANFRNKEDLFVAVAQRQIETYNAMALAAVQSKCGVQEKTEELLQRMGDTSEAADWSILMIEFSLFALRHPHLKLHLEALNEQFSRGITAVFAELYRESERPAPLPLSAIGAGHYCLIQGLALQSMLRGAVITPEIRTELLRIFLRAVLGDN